MSRQIVVVDVETGPGGPTVTEIPAVPPCACGHDRERHGPFVPGCVECECRSFQDSDTGQARETGADRAARPRRFTPEDALSVTERLGAAEPSGDTVQAPDVAALADRIRSVPPMFSHLDGSRDAVHALVAIERDLRALLGTDTTTEETP